MREPPALAATTIQASLQTHYGIAVTSLTFLPLGNDSASSVYLVQATDGAMYFLKARARVGFRLSSVVVPRYLSDHGVSQIVAPLPTSNQTLWVGVDDFALSLFPFIEGSIGADVGLSESQWRAFGALLEQIHSRQLPPHLLHIVPGETYTPSRRSVITQLEAAITKPSSTNSVEHEFAAFWRARRDDIGTLVHRADGLGLQLRQAPAPPVLCHGDAHTWNVLLDPSQRLWLVDWDETVIAPKERDLMFVVGGLGGDRVGPHGTACFLQGYGDSAIGPRELAYYRYAWAVQDIAAYGEQVFFVPDLGEEARRDALLGFMGLFSPGHIVALAFASDSTAA